MAVVALNRNRIFRKMVLQLCQGRSLTHEQSHSFWSCLGVSWSQTPELFSDTRAVLVSTPPAGHKAGRELCSYSSAIPVVRSVIIPVDTLE